MTDEKQEPKTLNLQIGGYSNLMQAQMESAEFKKPGVFARRSAIFPNPAAFSVKVTPVSAIAKAWPDPPSPLNQFYIDFTMTAEGTEAHIADWFRKVQSSVKIFHASATRKPGTMGERAAHLAARADAKTKKA